MTDDHHHIILLLTLRSLLLPLYTFLIRRGSFWLARHCQIVVTTHQKKKKRLAAGGETDWTQADSTAPKRQGNKFGMMNRFVPDGSPCLSHRDGTSSSLPSPLRAEAIAEGEGMFGAADWNRRLLVERDVSSFTFTFTFTSKSHPPTQPPTQEKKQKMENKRLSRSVRGNGTGEIKRVNRSKKEEKKSSACLLKRATSYRHTSARTPCRHHKQQNLALNTQSI
ncbi:hypothetical protein OUZ56_024929 [Daphnia magna]|uniref:Uncharacterized protein n=1 Tax=Daphnia magna TaxID=35525 RepID=A0ABQ9ZIF7_9CRUS|nr:hypothetical protein OUZ56_024929 [Daphnia magna]